MVLASEKEGRGMDGRVGNGRRRQAVRVPGRKEAAEEGEYSFDMREQGRASESCGTDQRVPIRGFHHLFSWRTCTDALLK